MSADDLSRADLRAQLTTALPLPCGGSTLERFEGLAGWGRQDLAMAKVLEPHADATAILHELEQPAPADESLWGVWAAEPPFAVLTAEHEQGIWHLSGRKAFCSGASLVTHALVTARADDGPRLFSVDVSDPGIEMDETAPPWQGPGMFRAGTRTLTFDRVEAAAVGGVDSYTQRTGFWFGAIGVAACWLGGAVAVADLMERSVDRLDAHGSAHLGAIRASVFASTSALHRSAQLIDDGRAADLARAERLALEVRAVIADTAEDVVTRVGRSLGPGPLAFDAVHVGRVHDLQMFVRQHHAERDLERLGRLRSDG